MSAHPVDMAYAVLRAVKETKEDSVSEMGVGTDILPSVFCFDEDGRVLSYAILFTPGEGRSVNVAILEAVAVMRKSWGCHAAVWAQESYTSPPTDDKRPLAERFPTDPEVRECITCLCVTVDGDAAYIVQPYRVTVPRRVEWLESRAGVGPADDHDVADLAHRIMGRIPVRRDPADGVEALMELGFVAMQGD